MKDTHSFLLNLINWTLQKILLNSYFGSYQTILSNAILGVNLSNKLLGNNITNISKESFFRDHSAKIINYRYTEYKLNTIHILAIRENFAEKYTNDFKFSNELYNSLREIFSRNKNIHIATFKNMI